MFSASARSALLRVNIVSEEGLFLSHWARDSDIDGISWLLRAASSRKRFPLTIERHGCFRYHGKKMFYTFPYFCDRLLNILHISQQSPYYEYFLQYLYITAYSTIVSVNV
jgi:hypothetical protein